MSESDVKEYRDDEERNERIEYGARDDERNESRDEVAFHIPRD
ncbi:MAG: hypothetical protein ACYC7A_06380 [Thermoanaerobaculia bacterium]